MSARSTRINLSNNTGLTLKKIGTAGPCHGSWTNDIEPPDMIGAGECASWESESSGIMTGTQAWVKYELQNNISGCVAELVFIEWDNPFIWSGSTKPIDFKVQTSDVVPPCDEDKGKWDTGGSVFPHGGTNPPACTHELIGVFARANNQGGITWWDVIVNWPVLLGLTFLGQMDISLEFTLALRQQGSVGQTVRSSSCVPAESIRAKAMKANLTSLRKLFHM